MSMPDTPIARSSSRNPLESALESRHRVTAALGAVAVWGLLWWTGLPPAEVVPGVAVAPYEIEGDVIDEDTAMQLYPVLARGGGRKLFDPVAFVVNLPDYGGLVRWPEHPSGVLIFRTNNMGFREDDPTRVETDDVRIFVLGDSHTDGAVANDESFANVLEKQLNLRAARQAEKRTYDVINGGVGGTGPYEMEGLLRKHMDLEPDMVIAALYTGNDFVNALMISDFYSKRRQKERTPEYTGPLMEASRRWGSVVAQGFNQAYLFRFDRPSAKVALEATVARYEAMAELCAERGIVFVALIIPTKPDVDAEDHREEVDALLQTLGMTRKQYSINTMLADRFKEAMEAAGIPVVDFTEAMARVERPLYWRKDHHLNVDGHAFLAHKLLPVVGKMLGNR